MIRLTVCSSSNISLTKTYFQTLSKIVRHVNLILATDFFKVWSHMKNLNYFTISSNLCRLPTAILDRPPSSAATMEVQGPDTK